MTADPHAKLSANPKPDKIAIVHDWLDGRVGGAERVLLELAELYPEAPIYTLVFEPQHYHQKIDPSRVNTSWLNRLPAFVRQRPKLLLPFIRGAIESFDFSEYDVVITSSGAWSKNIITPQRTLHICYCHSPARFLWDYRQRYIDELVGDKPAWLARPARFVIQRLTARLRRWDYLASSRVDVWLANSQHVAGRIARYYQRESEVLYPPVATAQATPSAKKGDYYVTLGTLTPYKKIDLIIQAFNDSGQKLVVIGEGPQRARLEQLAKDNIEFAGWVEEKHKWQLLKRARGLIFANEEDFGIAPVEALASNTPVIAYNQGGVSETVAEGENGILFDSQTPAAIVAAVKRSDQLNIDDRLAESARRFSIEAFRQSLAKIVQEGCQQKLHSRFEQPLSLLGVPIHPVNSRDTIDFIGQSLAGDQLCQLATVNAEFVMLARKDEQFKAILQRSALNVADGVGVLWALHWRFGALTRSTWTWAKSIAQIVLKPKVLRSPLAERVTGVDLVEEVAAEAVKRGWKLYLLGARHGVSQAAAANLAARYPGLVIAGSESGSPDASQDEAITGRINDSGADILLVAYGPPKQERWIARNADRLHTARVAFGVGGTFDFISGGARRAPGWLRAIGLEWLWRLLLQPSRIKRQLSIPSFLYKVYKSRSK